MFFNPFSSAAEVNTFSPWWEMGNAKAGVREALIVFVDSLSLVEWRMIFFFLNDVGFRLL